MTDWSQRRVLITGVSRPAGIGAALAGRFAQCGAVVAAHGSPAYDVEQRYPDAGPDLADSVFAGYAAQDLRVTRLTPGDLAASGAAERALEEAAEAIGPLTDLVLNHAYSTSAELGTWTAEHIDAHLTVNIRASMLLVQRFAQQAPAGRAITLMTSGQYLGPMTTEIAYAVSKEAIRNLALHLSVVLAPQGIRVNAVNPGPTDTGYLTGEAHEQVAAMFPQGRWGQPEDVARLVEFLHSDQGIWVTGQCIGSEGGFQR